MIRLGTLLIVVLLVHGCISVHGELTQTTKPVSRPGNSIFQSLQNTNRLANTNSEKPEWLVPWNTTTLDQLRMWPTWWNEQLEAKMKAEVLVGIVTTGYEGRKAEYWQNLEFTVSSFLWLYHYHRTFAISDRVLYLLDTAYFSSMHNRLAYQRASWWTDERIDMVEVYSDVDRDPSVPNLIFSHCDSSYHYGLWCKNTHMLQMWQTPRYRQYKWFIRANDDSYYHLENIYELVRGLDHEKPIVIGEKFCSDNPDGTYPSGGPGIILSRGFVQNVDWDKWNNPLKKKLKVGQFFEDVLWGRYLNDTGNIEFMQHHGISQSPMLPRSGHLNLFMEYRNKPWPLPFRPLAYHQSGKWTTLPILHRKLHAIDYYPPANAIFELPECKCRYNFHSRCMWDTKKKGPKLPCRWDGLLQECLGPGDYTVKGYRALVQQLGLSDDMGN